MTGVVILLIFVALLGACAGSFLNVVIYRLPRDLTPAKPARSFCPACKTPIAWYDNIPVVSWLALGGRCRQCRSGISATYPAVELLGAVVAIGLTDVMFVSGGRADFTSLATDWPMWLAHVVLFWALIAEAGIDIEHYTIDLRITWLVVAVGVAAHVIWTPDQPSVFLRAAAPTALAALMAMVGLVATFILVKPTHHDDTLESLDEHDGPAGRPAVAAQVAVVVGAAGVVAMVVLAGMAAALGTAGGSASARNAVGAVIGFAAIVAAGLTPRPADDRIVAAIEQERHQARRRALGELAWLGPALVLGVAALTVAAGCPWVTRVWSAAMAWSPTGQWQPIAGLTTALAGFVVAGAVGWLVRIVFTLALGKEAFGTGDIHLMAAAGAVAGWPVVVIGFFLASPVALLGVLILLVRKTSRAISFGPWLSLGLWLAVLYHDRVMAWLAPLLSVLADVRG